jgi:hypothetical protein
LAQRSSGEHLFESILIAVPVCRRAALHHTLLGVSVPIQDCRAVTAAFEVSAIPDGDDPITHAESVLASHGLIRRTPPTAVTRIDEEGSDA